MGGGRGRREGGREGGGRGGGREGECLPVCETPLAC